MSFDLLGPLPDGTVVLEASAGTGKTYTIAALATRYVAEANVPLSKHKTAIFRQVNKTVPHTHHDALEMPCGQTVMLTGLHEGQFATVLELPAQPKTKEEAQVQKRVEYIG